MSLWDVKFGPSFRIKSLPWGLLLFFRNDGDGRHLTVPLRPLRGVGGEGWISPHMTFPESEERHEFLARLRLEDITHTFRMIEAEVLERWLRATVPIDLPELGTRGWFVLNPSKADYLRWLASVKSSERRYDITEASLGDLALVTMESAVPPEALVGLDNLERPFQAIRPVGEDDSFESMWLGFFPHGLQGERPGWYTTPSHWLRSEDMRAILDRHVGAELWRALAAIKTRLDGADGRSDQLGDVVKL